MRLPAGPEPGDRWGPEVVDGLVGQTPNITDPSAHRLLSHSTVTAASLDDDGALLLELAVPEDKAGTVRDAFQIGPEPFSVEPYDAACEFTGTATRLDANRVKDAVRTFRSARMVGIAPGPGKPFVSAPPYVVGSGRVFVAPVGADPNDPSAWREVGWTDGVTFENLSGDEDDDLIVGAFPVEASVTLDVKRDGHSIFANDLPYAPNAPGGRGPLASLVDCLSFSADDWGASRAMAWVWGIVCGWDAGADDGAMLEMAGRHQWSDETVARLRALHDRFKVLEAEEATEEGTS